MRCDGNKNTNRTSFLKLDKLNFEMSEKLETRALHNTAELPKNNYSSLSKATHHSTRFSSFSFFPFSFSLPPPPTLPPTPTLAGLLIISCNPSSIILFHLMQFGLLSNSISIFSSAPPFMREREISNCKLNVDILSAASRNPDSN